MEKKIEEELYVDGLLHSDVPKVGHHGSRASGASDLLYAVHSPSPRRDSTATMAILIGTLRALAERHIAVYRTDDEGLVNILRDGHRLEAKILN